MLSERLKDFNTSNVTIQLDVSGHFYKGVIISIHLMLLFNLLSVVCVVTLVYFNTSNVTIQQLRVIHVAGLIKISIHLMLLFNSTVGAVTFPFPSFQYI